MKKMPSKMFRSVIHNKDFEVSLAYESEDLLPPGVSSPVFAQYAVTGLTDASEKYASRNLSSPIKANLHFSLSRSGIFSLDRADAVVEISEWVEVPRKTLTVENSTSASPNMSVDGGLQNASEESADSAINGGVSNTSNSSGDDHTTDFVPEKKLKKRTFRVPLKITEKVVGPGMPLSKEVLLEAEQKLEALDNKDAERKRTAELKNNLEGYIYATREKLESLEELKKVTSSEERQSFIEKLDEVQEWLYSDGEDASATEFQERLDSLKAIGDPIFFRLNELTARPAACEHARRYLGELEKIVHGWNTNKPWLPRERIDKVIKDAEKFKNWLNEKEAEQENTPAFTSEEVYEKVFDLQDKVASINKIPKPKPKVEKPVKNETESSGGDNDNPPDSSSETTAAQNDGQTAGDSEGGSNDEKTHAEPEVHDEL